MSIAVVDRRRIAAFAQALDELESGLAPSRGEAPGNGPDGPGDPETAAHLAAVALLRDTGGQAPAPAADFRAALRARLLDEAAALPAAAAVPAPRGAHRRAVPAVRTRATRWRRRCAVAGAALVLTGGSLGGIAYASTDALPGDMTYSVKRGIEDLKLSWAGSDRERGEEYLKQARTRLSEAERLLDRSGNGTVSASTTGHLKEVLTDMRDETTHGRALLTDTYNANQSKVGPMRDLADFAQNGRTRMDRIDERLPGELAADRAMVWNLLNDIRAQVTTIPGAVGPDDEASSGTGKSVGPGHPGTTQGPGGRPVPGTTQAPGAAPAPAQPGRDAVPGGAPGAVTAPAGVLPSVNIPLLEPTNTGTATPAATPSPVGVNVPAPALPPVGLNVPPLLPGLPGIGITIGGAPQTQKP